MVRQGGVEAHPVVAHVQRDLVLHVRNGQPDPGGVRVPGHVRQRLLRGAQQRELGLRLDRPRRPVVVTCAGIPFRADHRSATPASASLSRPPSSGSGRSASTDRRASVRLSRASRVAAATCRRQPGWLAWGPRSGLLGRLQLGDDPGKPLRERVVDLPRHPPPLVEDARPRAPGRAVAGAGPRSPRSSPPAAGSPRSVPRAARWFRATCWSRSHRSHMRLHMRSRSMARATRTTVRWIGRGAASPSVCESAPINATAAAPANCQRKRGSAACSRSRRS